ncbi:hypothetical protein FQB35_04585 [Crassaminicella thermophila]|uniref:Beta-lactamase inhibitor (BLIP) n=1 Tax=Crassaminicella thermophila TaxID=2599308 RepID=A0A5C0SCM3_CRATE|nr:hypothetical protein [Crassaminicella thermophila]QEK11697.1 hypothetical protein FQB35_04585 [Crassaminicella thermophila]
MKKIISLLIFVLLVSILTSCGNNTTKVTLENFNKIETGMTLKEVTAILGEGVQDAKTESKSIGLVVESYIWKNKDGSNIIIMFKNGKVDTKAQSFLK